MAPTGVASHHRILFLQCFQFTESMVMKFYGDTRGEVRLNFLARPLCLMRGSLTLFRIVHANVGLNIAIPSLVWFLKRFQCFQCCRGVTLNCSKWRCHTTYTGVLQLHGSVAATLSCIVFHLATKSISQNPFFLL